jgi:hypothetical protein
MGALAVSAAVCLATPMAAQRGGDSPEAVIRSLALAIYGNDVATYEKITLPHPQRSRLTAGGRVNESALQELKENPGALQIRERRPLLFKGEPAKPGPGGAYPVGTTGFYVMAHRSPMAVVVVKTADGWKIDPRWWIAMMELATGPGPAKGSPEEVIKSCLFAMLRLDREGATRFLADAKEIDLLFLEAPRQREPSGVLEASLAEMPLVEIRPGEFYPVPVGKVVEGVKDPNRKVLVGLFGPIEIPFVVRRVGSAWRLDAQPYFLLMNR